MKLITLLTMIAGLSGCTQWTAYNAHVSARAVAVGSDGKSVLGTYRVEYR